MVSIKNNINIEIAVAPSRLSKRWTNKRTTWLDLLQKCESTQRTAETVAEYKAMKREQQSERKDVGGFVGGYLKDGLRRGGMVSYRTLLTLDIDYGKQSVWEEYARLDPDMGSGDLVLDLQVVEGGGDEVYEVKSGDSLSKIASHYDGVSWKEIFEANRDQLDDPDKIFPGQKLRIPPLA